MEHIYFMQGGILVLIDMIMGHGVVPMDKIKVTRSEENTYPEQILIEGFNFNVIWHKCVPLSTQ